MQIQIRIYEGFCWTFNNEYSNALSQAHRWFL